MANGGEPLGLAYLVEIAFVLNLAYHELESYTLGHQVRGSIRSYLSRFQGMEMGTLTGSMQEMVNLNTCYQELCAFGEGKGSGWGGNRTEV